MAKIEGSPSSNRFEGVSDNIYARKHRKDQDWRMESHIEKYEKLGYLHTDSTLNTSTQSQDMELNLDEITCLFLILD